MASRFLLELNALASGFTESFLLGNGSFGASVLGKPGTESFALNLDTLWSGGPLGDEPGPSPAHLLQPLRDAIAAGDFKRADAISRDMQGPGWTQSYQPLGTLKLTYAAAAEISGYNRCLDLAKAEARTNYNSENGSVQLRSLVSAPAGVLLATIEGPGILAFAELALAFDTPHEKAEITVAEADGIKWMTVTGRVPKNVLPNYVDDEPAIVYADDTPDAAGTVAGGMGYAVVAALHQDAAGSARLIVSAESGFRGYDQRPSADVAGLAKTAKDRVTAALAQPIQRLVEDHREDYSSYFDRMDFDLSQSPVHDGLDPRRAELLYHYGRYLMISSSCPGTQPTNLQGIWNVDVRPAWSANYTININTEMNYWPAEMTGLGDLAAPLHQFVAEAAGARGQVAARHYYGARGATIHHNTDIWHFSAPVHGDPSWANWASGLIWLAVQLNSRLDYYPEDDAFLRTIALPVWREAVPFALDMLVEDQDGALVASPSTSPENQFFATDGAKVAVSAGSAMDQEMIRELLEIFVGFATADDAALKAEARAALAKLKIPHIDATGALSEWSVDVTSAEIGHRHLSHLFGLHPGRRITAQTTPEAFSGVRKALDVRLANGSGHTGWSQAWILCQAARLRDTARADKAIHGLLNDLAFKSLMVLHPHSGWEEGNVFQIDGNFGAVAGMTELVVQSRKGQIIILPTLPASWPTGSARNIRTVGGHSVDLAWKGGALARLTIRGGRAETIEVELPTSELAQMMMRMAGVLAVEGKVCRIELQGEKALNFQF
ncbi:glycoside hydrolase family 95 protein [Devosia sp. BK]|uniref:glycoside hydrolase family 95 protein n=1 Tax=Devosia sp. BK TaxID=2871706 RepID=UPI00293A7D26|nr:glycoside hydrolase family 95 protein [Devosia sp. BK]MDV3251621.1 glycoside hydrolase family 95 protein [Devosia sp. BK]